MAWLTGCASSPSGTEQKAADVQAVVESPAIREIYLSPGDEIRIAVLGHPELTRQVLVDPNGTLFFPLVGELSVTGMSVRQLRESIAATLSAKRDHTLSPGDQIAVKVYRHGEFDFQGILPQNGAVLLPLAGEVNISGLTLAEAGKAIAQKLTAYVVKPQVTVQVIQYQGQTPIGDPQVSLDLIRLTGEKFFVLGEVRVPGVFALQGNVQLLDAIALAGGMKPDAKEGSILLVKPGGPGKKPETRVIDLDKFLKKGDLSSNPVIARGDIIFVPETIISSVGRYFSHVMEIVEPIVEVETGIWLGQNIDGGVPDRNITVTPVISP